MKEAPYRPAEYKQCPNCLKTRHITAFTEDICKVCSDFDCKIAKSL